MHRRVHIRITDHSGDEAPLAEFVIRIMEEAPDGWHVEMIWDEGEGEDPYDDEDLFDEVVVHRRPQRGLGNRPPVD